MKGFTLRNDDRVLGFRSGGGDTGAVLCAGIWEAGLQPPATL